MLETDKTTGRLGQSISVWLSNKIIRILVCFALGWIVTVAVLWVFRDQFFGLDKNIFRDVFVAWAGELLFFSIVGLAVTVITIEKPKDPRGMDFDERVKILFGYQTVPQIVQEFHKKSLQSIARYSSSGRRRIIIKSFTPELDAYSVTVHNNYVIKSAIRDVDLVEKIPMRIKPDSFESTTLTEAGRINHIIINGKEKITSYTAIPINGFATEFEEDLSPEGSIIIETEYEILMRCGSEQIQRARRIADSMDVEIINQMSGNVTIILRGKSDAPITLLPNQPARQIIKGVQPEEVIMAYTLLSPRTDASSAAAGKAGVAEGIMAEAGGDPAMPTMSS